MSTRPDSPPWTVAVGDWTVQLDACSPRSGWFLRVQSVYRAVLRVMCQDGFTFIYIFQHTVLQLLYSVSGV